MHCSAFSSQSRAVIVRASLTRAERSGSLSVHVHNDPIDTPASLAILVIDMPSVIIWQIVSKPNVVSLS